MTLATKTSKSATPVTKIPQHLELASHLRRRITSGELRPGDKLPSFTQMRSEMGAMPTTVDRMLDALESEGLIVRERGRGTFVTSPPQKPAHVIAVSPRLLSAQQNPYDASMLVGINEKAQETRTEVIFSSYGCGNIWKRSDGMIVSHEPLSNFGNPPANFPFISLIGTVEGAHCVTADDHSGVYQLTEHLIGLGHRRIAVLYAWGPGSAIIDSRYKGYRDALEAHRIEYEANLVRVQNPRSRSPLFTFPVVEAGYEGIRKWLSEDFKALGCTAVLAYNDDMAVGIVRGLQEAGLRVPEDVSVTGYDGTPAFDYLQPRLTTIRVPLQEIGSLGLEFLLRRIQGESDIPALTQLPVSLQTGESTGPCR